MHQVCLCKCFFYGRLLGGLETGMVKYSLIMYRTQHPMHYLISSLSSINHVSSPWAVCLALSVRLCLSVCLNACLFFFVLYICLSVSLSVFLCVFISIFVSLCPPSFLSVYLSLCPSLHLTVFVFLSVYPSTYLTL